MCCRVVCPLAVLFLAVSFGVLIVDIHRDPDESWLNHALCGIDLEKPMPDWGFRGMTFVMWVTDFFHDTTKRLDAFDLAEGMSACDFGVGPARLVPRASELVGPTGKVYGIDVHRYAIEKVEALQLENVEAIHSTQTSTPLPDDTCDVLYALDMFHHVPDKEVILAEWRRLVKPTGRVYIDNHHQSRKTTLEAVDPFEGFEVVNEDKWNDKYLKLIPK